VKNTLERLLALLVIWAGSYVFVWMVIKDENFFVPTFTALLSAVALYISPHKNTRRFFHGLRPGRAFFAVLIPASITIFGSADGTPDYMAVPPSLGLFLITSSLVDRMTPKK